MKSVYKQESSAGVGCGTITSSYLTFSIWVNKTSAMVLAVALGLSEYQQVGKQESSASVGCDTITSAYLAINRWVSKNPVLMLAEALLPQPNYLSAGGQGCMAQTPRGA